MTDFTQEFNEASKNKVMMRIFRIATYNEQHSIALILEIRDTKLFKMERFIKLLFAFKNQTRSIFASRKGKLILKHASEEPRQF